MKVNLSLANRVNTKRVPAYVWQFVRLVMIIGISYVILLPLMSKLVSTFMQEADAYDPTVRWIPKRFTLNNLRIAWEYMEYPKAFGMSLLIALSVTVLQLVSCTMIGYGLARFNFRGRHIWFGIVVFMLVVPPQLIHTPLYLNFRFFDLFGLIPGGGVNLINTPWPLALLAITGTGYKNGLFIFIARQYFRGMPKELEESAYVDGAGAIQTFIRIMVPGAVPILIVIFLFSFVWQWNDSYFIMMYMGERNVLPVALTQFVTRYFVEMSGLSSQQFVLSVPYASVLESAGMLLFIAPLLILYTFAQRFLIESVERTGIVG